jgi:adenosylmethionine-8-amino-7-oxononanoate aminotransferase
VLRRLRSDDLVDASRSKGDRLRSVLAQALEHNEHVGDVRGRGLLVGVELVADRATRAPFPRSERVTERILAAARRAGLLLYPATGGATGEDGDVLMFGPPFVIADGELDEAAGIAVDAIESVV